MIFNPTEVVDRLHLSAESRISMISDLHLTPARDDISRRLEDFLQSQRGEIDHLFILGDLFDYWIGDDASHECNYEDIETILYRFSRETNCHLYVMHGNRDFLLGTDFCNRNQCQLINDPCLLQIGEISVLLAHGDAYCIDDIDHQAFRRTTRTAEWQQNFLNLPIVERIKYANQVRAQSEAGKAIKSAAIMDVSPDAIEQEFANYNVRLLIHGHTHRPAVHNLELAGTECLRIVLGDWFEQKSYLEISNGKIKYSPKNEQHRVDLYNFSKTSTDAGSSSI